MKKSEKVFLKGILASIIKNDDPMGQMGNICQIFDIARAIRNSMDEDIDFDAIEGDVSMSNTIYILAALDPEFVDNIQDEYTILCSKNRILLNSDTLNIVGLTKANETFKNYIIDLLVADTGITREELLDGLDSINHLTHMELIQGEDGSYSPA